MTIGSLHPNLVPVLCGILLLLLIATLITAVLARRNPQADYTNLKQRIKSWWLMAGAFALAITVHWFASLCFFGFLSFIAFKEYLTLIPMRRVDRAVLAWAYLSIPIHYYWVAIQWYGMAIIFIPVYMFLFMPIVMVLIGETKGFLRAAGTIHWGLMTTVFSIGHAPFFLMLPNDGNPNGGGPGLLLFLVFLTQMNDVSQYVWGKQLGKHKVIPKVSPNKTWEGFLGGLATTTVLALILAPMITPLSFFHSLVAGLYIGLAGFFGDLSISALKRDLGIKDSGSMIPGHGGVLDRVDSLTYTAPLFFHFVRYFYY